MPVRVRGRDGDRTSTESETNGSGFLNVKKLVLLEIGEYTGTVGGRHCHW